MKRRYETPRIDKRDKLANVTADDLALPKISGITFTLPEEPV